MRNCPSSFTPKSDHTVLTEFAKNSRALFQALPALISRLMGKFKLSILKVPCSRPLLQMQLPQTVNGDLLVGTSGDGGCQAEEGGLHRLHGLASPKDSRSSWWLLGDQKDGWFCGFGCKCWTIGGIWSGHRQGLFIGFGEILANVWWHRKERQAVLVLGGNCWPRLGILSDSGQKIFEDLLSSVAISKFEEEPMPPKSENYFKLWRQKLSR